MKTALLMLLLVATASPVLAGPHRANWVEPSPITCETFRAYVNQGLATATAIARANGMTAVQERKARQCLATRRPDWLSTATERRGRGRQSPT